MSDDLIPDPPEEPHPAEAEPGEPCVSVVHSQGVLTAVGDPTKGEWIRWECRQIQDYRVRR